MSTTRSEYYYVQTFDPSEPVVVRGEEYHQIQLGHRTAFVKAADVDVPPSKTR